jgi:hypothetical protein
MGLRSNRNSGAASTSYLRLAFDAQDVNSALSDTRKMGQRNRIAVLTHIARNLPILGHQESDRRCEATIIDVIMLAPV